MKPTFFDDNDPNNPKKKTYIEREALIKKQYAIDDLSEFGIVEMVVSVEDIKNAPTADVVEVRHGHIIETVKNGKCNRVFSCCGKDYTKLTQWIIPNYCPNCGAKMDGKGD